MPCSQQVDDAAHDGVGLRVAERGDLHDRQQVRGHVAERRRRSRAPRCARGCAACARASAAPQRGQRAPCAPCVGQAAEQVTVVAAARAVTRRTSSRSQTASGSSEDIAPASTTISTAKAQSARPGTTLAMPTSFVTATRIPIRNTSIMLQGWTRRSRRNMRRHLPGHAAEVHRQQHVEQQRDLRERREHGGEADEHGDLRHALLPEVEDAGGERGLGDAAPHLEREEREDVRDGEEHARGHGERERALDRLAPAPAQHGAAARAVRRRAFGHLGEPAQQVAVVAGDEGHERQWIAHATCRCRLRECSSLSIARVPTRSRSVRPRRCAASR